MKLFDLIRELINTHWHGELRIKFYGGVVKHIEKIESVDLKTMENVPQT